MRESLQVGMRDGQYREMLARYHFAPRDLPLLGQVGELVRRAAEPELYWDRISEQGEQGEELAVIVTLGAGPDELQNRYQQRERLSESYMAECVGMELLRNAYEQAAERIHERTDMWPSAFAFVGEQEPFARMEEIFRLLAPQGVSYNQAYMLTPKKTAVFLTELRRERKDSYCHICAGCTNLSCRNREEREGRRDAAKTQGNLTYGYQRIFGGWKRE